MKDALGYYKVLGVTAAADGSLIKQAYRDLAKKWHPDYNKDRDTTDIFQKLSVAYEILSTPKSRLIYDILSLVYRADNYPDIEVMTPFRDKEGDTAVKSVSLSEVLSFGAGYKIRTVEKPLSYGNALKLSTKISIINWIAGWWHPKGCVQNFKALVKNFTRPISQRETLKIYIHNMIAYAKENKPILAAQSGILAKKILSGDDRKLIDVFLNELAVKVSVPAPWNMFLLKISQLIMPFMIICGAFWPIAENYADLSEADLWGIFSKKKEIDYYQRVNFGNKGEGVDDVVVGKVISIPVDKSDVSKLYHLSKESVIMYGPSDDFDSMKKLPAQTTVRLTGLTPDNVWARIMIDNGETGFIRMENLKNGIGKEIPFGSSITE